MTPATRFRIASHRELFTAVALVQLRDEGRLRLEDPVSAHLPWFRVGSAHPSDPPITLEELLTHSSGLPREAAFSPETRWKYSNLAYAVAGMVVEEVTGMEWADYIQSHILEPLGMGSTSVDREDPLVAVGYGRRMPDGTRDIFPFVDSRGVAAATGMTSTVEDMSRFVSAQFPTSEA